MDKFSFSADSFGMFEWMGSTYEQQLQAVLSLYSQFNELDPELKVRIETFLIEDIRLTHLVQNLRNNKDFRNFFRNKLDYLLSPLEEIMEDEDVFDRFMDLKATLHQYRFTANIDPRDRIPAIIAETDRRYVWNDFGITKKVVEDFEIGNFYDYEPEFFDKFRDLMKWLYLDILDYFDLLDTPEA